MSRAWRSGLVLVLLTCLLVACQVATSTQVAPTTVQVPPVSLPGLTIYPSWTPTLEPTSTPIPTATHTLIPSRTPTITLSPTPRQIPVYEPQTVLTVDLLLEQTNDAMHDLIVFISSSLSPFNISGMPNETIQDPALTTGPRLWAFSPDGRRSGRLTFDDVPFAAFYPSTPDVNPIFIEYGVGFNHPALQTVTLPQECYGWLPEEEANLLAGAIVEPCSEFRFSVDGKYLAFFFGPTICGRGLMVIDTLTNEIIFRSPAGTTLGFEFLANGKIIRHTSSCEIGAVSLLDPLTGTETHLGTAGLSWWNHGRTALVVAVSPFQYITGAVWGYSVTSDQVFLPEPEIWPLDNHPLWAPDGRHLLYQHRKLTISTEMVYSFTGPRELILVDSQAGTQQVVAGVEGYDYHLCASATNECDLWYGDWVQVRRYPFQPVSFHYTDDFLDSEQVTCLLYGRDCTFQPELFALNWNTGELLPWDEAPLPSPTPYATPLPTLVPGPNLDLPPVYADPLGKYAFYLGNDSQSLWLVAPDGTTELWVREGERFLYLP